MAELWVPQWNLLTGGCEHLEWRICLQFKEIKATSSASVCHGSMAESWINGLEIRTVAVETREG